MALENLKISDDRSQELAKKMKEVKVLDEATSLETTDLAKNAIASLDNPKLATFIETQFKAGDKRKSFAELTADPMYVFTVQSSLDALGYDALLTGGDTTFGIDEVYGSRTKAAVIKFQEDAGLAKKDGLVGEETFAALVGKLKDPTFKPILPETPSTDVVDNTNVVRDANGKLLVDAYGNAVNYITSLDNIDPTKFNTPDWGKNIYVINGYTIYGNGRVLENKTKKMYNWEDVKDAIIVKTPDQLSSVDTEPFGTKTFDAMVATIQKDIVSKLGADTLGYMVYLVDKNDPSISVKLIGNGQNKSIPINLNSYQGQDGLDVVKLTQYIVNLIATEKKALDQVKEKEKKMNDWVNSIRGKKYTLSTLFPDLQGKRLQQYKTFFAKFANDAVEIDSSPVYTKLSSDKKNIIFDLNQSGLWDDKHVQGITIPVDKIFDTEGNPKSAPEQLKVLADVIKDIVENKENGYV